MGFWVKLFRDGSKENGSDKEIEEKRASWSKGRQDDIKTVGIDDGKKTASIQLWGFDSEWFQFDNYACLVSDGEAESIRTHRIVQFKITEEMVDNYVDFCAVGRKNYMVYIDGDCETGEGSFGIHSLKIEDDFVGKWFSLILPSQAPPYMELSASKGRLDGNFKQVFK